MSACIDMPVNILRSDKGDSGPLTSTMLSCADALSRRKIVLCRTRSYECPNLL